MKSGFRRYRRTIFLALLATATLVWAAIDQFDIAPVEMAWLLLYSAIGVFGIIAAAALSFAVLKGLGALWARLFGGS